MNFRNIVLFTTLVLIILKTIFMFNISWLTVFLPILIAIGIVCGVTFLLTISIICYIISECQLKGAKPEDVIKNIQEDLNSIIENYEQRDK